MDKKELQQKITEYYEKLPKEAQTLFASMSWLETLKQIISKYSLTEEQAESIGTETTLLLLGMISTDDFRQNLKKEININDSGVDIIIKEIEEKIIKDIEPLLYKSYSDNAMGLAQEKFGNRFDARLESLPDEVKEAISNSNYQSSVYEIANKHDLNISQMGILEEITTKVLTGFIKPDKFEEEVKNKVNTPEDKTKEIVAEINEKVFKNIKEILVGNWEKEETKPIPPYVAKSVPLPISENIKIEKNTDIQIPLPPYKAPVKEIPPKSETDIYKEHGIEIIENEPVSPPTKGEISEGQRGPGFNILAQKLTENTSSKVTVTDYSLPKVNPKIQPVNSMQGGIPAKAHDPYHEAV